MFVPSASAMLSVCASHNGSTALLEQIGLLRRKLHPHATAAARGQDRPAGDGDRAIGVQGLVVRCVGGPDSDLAAGDCHGAVGIQTIAAGAEGRDVATGNGDLKGSVLQLGIGGIDAVIRRGDLQITAAGVTICAASTPSSQPVMQIAGPSVSPRRW